MDELVGLTKNFRKVVITSRTQFFPNEEEIPGEIRVPKPGTDKPGFHRFRVMYVSPFDRKDIESFIAKKYRGRGPKTKEKRKKAQQIVERSPKLMVRPMLLSNIDDFIEDESKAYHHAYEIYEVLIEKWIEREGRRKPEAERENFYAKFGVFFSSVCTIYFSKVEARKSLGGR